VKTLILCVDRDDDLGQKVNAQTPIVGRRRVLEAAVALGLADPEDSDTNALLAAVHLYDKELASATDAGHQIEVATIAGDRHVGLRADRQLTLELEEVLALVRPDEVILVSDGAEDEQILPLLQSRVKVGHVHRSIVKQAPRLEGAYYIITRLLDDEKQAKRFVLPLGIILLIWGTAFFAGFQNYAWGATLAIAGLWLLVHAMRWEQKVGKLLSDMWESLRAGRAALVANVVLIIVVAAGAAEAYGSTPTSGGDPAIAGDEATPSYRAVIFLGLFLPYLVGGLLVRTAGQLFDAWFRERRAGIGHWSAAFTLIAMYLILDVALRIVRKSMEDAPLRKLLGLDLTFQLAAGLAVAMGGAIIARYLRSVLAEPAAAAPR
jgi:putative membrane protein